MKSYILRAWFSSALLVSAQLLKHITLDTSTPRTCLNAALKSSPQLQKSSASLIKAKAHAPGRVSSIQTRQIRIISVYVHVVAEAKEALPLVTDTIINDQIKLLNTAYSGTGFQFVNKGKTQTTNVLWATAGGKDAADELVTNTLRDMRRALRKGRYQDLNLFLVSSMTASTKVKAVGFCTPPAFLEEEFNAQDKVATDGCVIDWITLPTKENPRRSNQGKTAVHEVGHWLALLHPWADIGCNGDDWVDDTPRQAGGTYIGWDEDCPKTVIDTCPTPGVDDWSNYMDYTNDECLNHFTAGQIQRMNEFWVFRQGL